MRNGGTSAYVMEELQRLQIAIDGDFLAANTDMTGSVAAARRPPAFVGREAALGATQFAVQVQRLKHILASIFLINFQCTLTSM